MKKKLTGLYWLSLLTLVTVFSRSAYADSPPLALLKTSLASVQQVLDDPKLAGDKQLYQRRKLVRIVLQQLFDFE